jgi:hypothetical protein
LSDKFFFQPNFKGHFVVFGADTVATRLFQARQISGFFFGRRYFAESRQRFGSKKQLFRNIRLSARPLKLQLTLNPAFQRVLLSGSWMTFQLLPQNTPTGVKSFPPKYKKKIVKKYIWKSPHHAQNLTKALDCS